MKIVEALKTQKRIEDRINRNNKQITQYSSKLNTEKSYFENEEIQKKEVESLIQSSHDLVNRYLWLKRCIDHTNLNTFIVIDGNKYCITDLLNMKRKTIEYILSSYKALNDNLAQNRLISMRQNADAKTIQIERLYDERFKNEKIAYWQDLYDNIDSRLEVINATTDLIELSPYPKMEMETSV